MMNDDAPYQYVNGELIALSGEEVAEHAAAVAQWDAGSDARLSADIRRTRDNLLRDSDVSLLRALEDAADTSQLRSYRQSLRDVPQQPGFPTQVDWPTANFL
ncbi:MAG: phage tail assembly chaperone [Puniceicoccales bacterium]|jgi:hypothetical protein|nr:phage tail assembly chaperone [Puniceicoccales bacterium]